MASQRMFAHNEDLYMAPSAQLLLTNTSSEQLVLVQDTVECLGMVFPSEEARRTYFTERLRQKLTDPAFRQTPGFPQGTDEDILRLSDPPWYVACPNPFLDDFVRVYGTPFDPHQRYACELFAVDMSVGKTDALSTAHAYHTKVPYRAIVPFILHYTEPGDIVLDGFAGSGMTSVAAQWCGVAPPAYRTHLEAQWATEGRSQPTWGYRRSILNDLSPAATFIAANYTLPFDLIAFAQAAPRLLAEVQQELGWMYATLHTDGRTTGRINYTVWSEVFTCPLCAGEVNFVAEALEEASQRIRDTFPCPHCRTSLTKRQLQRLYETRMDHTIGAQVCTPTRQPIRINYTIGSRRYEKVPAAADLELLATIASLPLPPEVPIQPLPYMHMTHERAHLDRAGITHLHHFFVPRAAQALGLLWRKATATSERRLRNMLLFVVEQAMQTMTLQNRFVSQGFTQVNKSLPGVYYIPSHLCEVSPWYAIAARGPRLARAFARARWRGAQSMTSTGDCATLLMPPESVDYVFTDPPFGENIYYADLNYLLESWHHVFTDPAREAIIDRAKQKRITEYHAFMQACFQEYARVLKPGRWMTVVFSNASPGVWRALQNALGTAGFVIADVRTLDKQHGSYRQVTSTAVKQDLILSAYKPTQACTTRFVLGASSPDTAWTFVTEHLAHLPLCTHPDARTDIVTERTPQVLYDRMVAFHVQHLLSVPLSIGEFLAGLQQRYLARDGMVFLASQIAEYDQRRANLAECQQLSLFE
jgi:16S rRNA G966 N2-methylase RsmD